MNKVKQSLIVAALLGNLSVKEVKAMSLQAQNSAKAHCGDYSMWEDSYEDEEEEEESGEGEGFSGDESFSVDDGFEAVCANRGRGYRSCSGGCNNSCSCNDNCCPCDEEFEEVHCAIGELTGKVCDIQTSQESQVTCLGNIKTGLAENGEKLDLLQTDVTQILTDLTTIIEGGAVGTLPGDPVTGNGGPLVCIKVGGGCCDTCGSDTTCCCDPLVCCPPIEPPIEPPGEIIPDPDPLCLISGGGVGFGNGDLIELWFSAKTRSCSRDYYLGSPSINWLGLNECGLEGFHGEAIDNLPGEVEVSQGAFYVKRNSQIPGLADATTWLYDTNTVDEVNADFDPTLGLEFQGAQLVDSEGLCLTRPEGSILSNEDIPVPQFIIYVEPCVDYLGNIEDAENVDAIIRQTWIIEHT